MSNFLEEINVLPPLSRPLTFTPDQIALLYDVFKHGQMALYVKKPTAALVSCLNYE
jgi:hypothetical protein